MAIDLRDLATAVHQGPLAEWLDREAGPSLALDLAIHLASALALYGAARALNRSRSSSAFAAALLAAHPAALGAVALPGARGIVAASAFGLAAIAALRLPRALGAGASLALLLGAMSCGSLVACGFGVTLLAIQIATRRSRIETWTTAILTGAPLGFAVGLFTSGTAKVAGLAAGGLALLPVSPAPDLAAMCEPGGAPWARLLALLPFVALLGVPKPAWRAASLGFLAATLTLAFCGDEASLLHDRGPAALAPLALLVVSAPIDAALARSRRWTRPALVAAVALFAALGILRFRAARDVDAYLADAVQTAPRSAILREAYGRVLAQRARATGVEAARRTELFASAARELDRAADDARDPWRRSRVRRAAADTWLASGSFADTDAAISRLEREASTPDVRAEAALLRAKWFEASDKPAEAVEILRAAAEANPTSSLARRQYLRVATAFHSGRFARAKAAGSAEDAAAALTSLDALERSLDADLQPSAPAAAREAALVSKARVELARGLPVDAIRSLNDARAIDPRDRDVYLVAADAYLARGLPDGASAELMRGLESAGPSSDLLVALAAVELQRGEAPEKVVELMERAREVDPGAPQLRATLGAARIAVAEKRLEKGDVAGAEPMAVAAADDAPKLGHAHAVLGRVREAQKRYPEALAAYGRAFALEPSDDNRDALSAAWKREALARLLRKDRDGAADAFATVRDLASPRVDLGSGADVLAAEARAAYEAAVAALQKKDNATARAKLDRSLRLLPNNPYALSELGTLVAESGDDAKAVEIWTRALDAATSASLDLTKFPLHLNLAQAYRRLGNNDRAKEVAKACVALGDGPYRARCEAMVEVIELLEKTRR